MSFKSALGFTRPVFSLRVPIHQVGPGRSESVKPWHAEVPGADRQAAYYFRDNLGNKSARITVTSESFAVSARDFAGAKVTPSPGGGPSRLTATGKSVDARFTIEAVDRRTRELQVLVLVPWERDSARNLRVFLHDYSIRLGVKPEQVNKALALFKGRVLPPKRPVGWEVKLLGVMPPNDTLRLEPRERKDVVVRFAVPSPGSAVFMLKVVDSADRTSVVVSDIIEIDRPKR